MSGKDEGHRNIDNNSNTRLTINVLTTPWFYGDTKRSIRHNHRPATSVLLENTIVPSWEASTPTTSSRDINAVVASSGQLKKRISDA